MMPGIRRCGFAPWAHSSSFLCEPGWAGQAATNQLETRVPGFIWGEQPELLIGRENLRFIMTDESTKPQVLSECWAC